MCRHERKSKCHTEGEIWCKSLPHGRLGGTRSANEEECSKQNDRYVIDQKPRGNGERFVDRQDDKGLAEAVRDALEGVL